METETRRRLQETHEQVGTRGARDTRVCCDTREHMYIVTRVTLQRRRELETCTRLLDQAQRETGLFLF